MPGKGGDDAPAGLLEAAEHLVGNALEIKVPLTEEEGADTPAEHAFVQREVIAIHRGPALECLFVPGIKPALEGVARREDNESLACSPWRRGQLAGHVVIQAEVGPAGVPQEKRVPVCAAGEAGAEGIAQREGGESGIDSGASRQPFGVAAAILVAEQRDSCASGPAQFIDQCGGARSGAIGGKCELGVTTVLAGVAGEAGDHPPEPLGIPRGRNTDGLDADRRVPAGTGGGAARDHAADGREQPGVDHFLRPMGDLADLRGFERMVTRIVAEMRGERLELDAAGEEIDRE